MGLLNSALQTGRTAILGYEGALQTVGTNVSNAGSPDHTRLTPDLQPVQGPPVAGGLQPGAGVALASIQRNIDQSLEERVRLATGATEAVSTEREFLALLGTSFDDVTGTGLATGLRDFFFSFDELQNDAESAAVRDLTIAEGVALADSLRSLRSDLLSTGEAIDGQIEEVVVRADALAREIAKLNGQITTAESTQRGQAHALRDQRDALLRDLGELTDITVREQTDGTINVYVAGETLVQGSVSRGLVAQTEIDGEFTRTSIRFADTNQQVTPRTGRLAGLIRTRDEHAYGRVAGIDQLAAGIIADVNRIHADGQGLVGFTELQGDYDVSDVDAALNDSAAGLPFPPQSGSFYVTVVDDATGTPVAHRIDINLDDPAGATSLSSLVQQLNDEVTGITAEITPDNRLSVVADNGFSFTFGFDGQEPRRDTSGVLAALGVNTFFSGRDATDIAVSENITSDPSLLAAATVFEPGDGGNAGRLASLETAISATFGDVSITDYYNAIANGVATAGASANERAESAETVLLSLAAQRESISGVNLDEEAISLVKYERAFQGAARFISVVDQMIGELVALIR